METKNLTLEETIESDTFTPTGEKLGSGCWGRVDLYRDRSGNEWAIKVFSPTAIAKKQMEEREWTEEDVMRKESLPLYAATENVAPRLIERDMNGKMYVAMPVFRDNLADRIKYMGLDEVLNVAQDIVRGLKYLHNHRGLTENPENHMVHGDLKPSNVLMKNSRAFLTDFGSSTCISIGGSGSPRGPHGDINYRAPECFKEGAAPSTKSDIWSLGAIMYEAITKKGIYEGIEIDPSNLTEERLGKELSKKLRKVPRSVRPFLKKCLAANPWERFYDGTEAFKSLEETIRKRKENSGILYTIKKWTLPAAAASLIGGAIVYNALVTPEPQRLGIPTAALVQGMLEKPGKTEIPIVIDKEDFQLPKAREIGMMASGYTHYAKRCTDNRFVAYLAKTLGQASLIYGPQGYTQEQFNTFMQYTTNYEREELMARAGHVWPVWAKSIEVAMAKSEIEKGKVDLEDVMAISIAGEDTVTRAKRISKSFNYVDYRKAQDSDGKPIISKKYQRIIEGWRAYYEADMDM